MESAAPPTQIGRFKILEKIGEGAMGTVYKAMDTLIQRIVAIKTIRLDVDRQSEKYVDVCQRFYHEARVSATLIHPNIVTLFDLGEHEGMPFLAMEFVEGQTLSRRMVQEPGPTLRELCDILEQVASALDFAHEKSIIHRDVKPGNIMLDTTGKVKVMDFGIAKVVDQSITRTGTFVGTPSYISPEQASEGKVDYRSDLFSLGVLTFEMFTGEKPFQGTTIPNLLYKIVFENPARPRNLAKWEITVQQWDRVFSRALAKDPEKRYQSAVELVSSLRLNFLQESQPFRPVLAPSTADTAKLSSGIRHDIPPAVIEHVLEETRSKMNVLAVSQAADVESMPLSYTAPPIEDTGITSRSKAISLLLLLLVTGVLTFFLLRVLSPGGGGGPEPVPLAAAVMVSVSSQPPGAEIFLDGARTGKMTPAHVEVAGRSGERHDLLLRKPCYEEYQVPMTMGHLPEQIAPVLDPAEVGIEVQTEPTGATLILDGKPVEDSPATLPLDCGGKHTISASKDGYRTATRDIDPASETSPIVLTLEKRSAPGTVDVIASYAYQVYLGRSLLRTADGRSTIELDPGSYSLRFINKDHLLDFRAPVTVESGRTSQITLPGLGWFTSILANPENCDISIDGRQVGSVPIRNLYVAPGEHTITFRWVDGRTKSITRSVLAGQPIPAIFEKP